MSELITIRFNREEYQKLEEICDTSKPISAQIKSRLFAGSSSGVDSEESISLLKVLSASINTMHSAILSMQEELSDTKERLANIESFLEKISEE